MRWAIDAVELWLLVWFVLVGWEAFMQRATRGLPSPFNLLELHHAYLGAALVAIGFALHSVTGTLVQLLGLVLTIDDHVQHAIQTYSEDRTYASPLHQLFTKTLWRIPWMPALVEFLDARWWAIAVLAAAAWVVLGCRPAGLVPMALRPDTRGLSGVMIDSLAASPAIAALRSAYPNEGAVCFYGTLRDTVINAEPRRLIRVHRMEVAAHDSADLYHVYLVARPRSGCFGAGLVGAAHSHPYALAPEACTQSDLDANVIFADPRLLFSLIFCGDGRAELMYQDGRRIADRWLPAPDSSK